jgi:hypothetical protein
MFLLLLFLLVDRRIRMRIREAQKHMDPTEYEFGSATLVAAVENLCSTSTFHE